MVPISLSLSLSLSSQATTGNGFHDWHSLGFPNMKIGANKQQHTQKKSIERKIRQETSLN